MYPIYHPYTGYMYVLNLFYMNDLYLKCPLYRVPIYGMPLICTLYIPCIHGVCMVHVPYMCGTVISNAWYIAWYVWYIYYVCVVYCIYVCAIYI